MRESMVHAPLKKLNIAWDMKTIKDREGRPYLVFRTKGGHYHVFAELNAKEAAIALGAPRKPARHTDAFLKAVWDANE